MKIESIAVDTAINNVKQLLEEDANLSSALKSAIEVLILLVSVLLNRATLSSKYSSKLPSSGPNRLKQSRKKSDKSSGAQKGHVGVTLPKINDPDEIAFIEIDRRNLPKGHYTEVKPETRQVFDIVFTRQAKTGRIRLMKIKVKAFLLH